MIDWKTILSSFDDKPTLLQWLKIVEKALQNASLKDVAIKVTEDNKFVFEFKFADGSTVTSSSLTLPKDITYVEEISSKIVGSQTETTLRLHYSDGTLDEFPIFAENGKDGKGISRIEKVSDEIVGTKTITTIRAQYTDGTSDDFSVAAENGKDGSGKLYIHHFNGLITLSDGKQPSFEIEFLSYSNTKITSKNEFVQFAYNNRCYLTTLDSDGTIFYGLSFNQDYIIVRGLKADGTKFMGRVSVLGDDVVTEIR